MTQPKPEWPFYIDDPVLAVHFAMERRECLYGRPETCPHHGDAHRAIDAYTTWQAAHADTPKEHPAS